MVFHVVVLCLFDLNAMHGATQGFQRLLQLFPERDRQILCAAQSTAHERYIHVQILVVHIPDHFVIHDAAQFTEVHDETGQWVRSAFHRDPKLVVMPMPVGIRALPEDLHVLFGAPVGLTQFMCSAKTFAACYVYGCHCDA